MNRRKLTVTDLCKVSGYSRDQIRRLLEELPVYSDQPTDRRVAREFFARDLIVISVLFVLEFKLYVKRSSFTLLIDQLASVLTGPKPANRFAMLHLSFSPIAIQYVTEDASFLEGTLVSLGPIFEKVDTYLSSDQLDLQRELELGFTDITTKKMNPKVINTVKLSITPVQVVGRSA
jgi:hypothetical protein